MTEKLYRFKPLDWQPRGETLVATSMGVDYILSLTGTQQWGISYSNESSLFPERANDLEAAKARAEELRLEKWLNDLEEVPCSALEERQRDALRLVKLMGEIVSTALGNSRPTLIP